MVLPQSNGAVAEARLPPGLNRLTWRSPPPQYVLALAWRRDEQAAAAHRFLAYLRSYRDRHAWITGPQQHRRLTTVTQALLPRLMINFGFSAFVSTSCRSASRFAVGAVELECGR